MELHNIHGLSNKDILLLQQRYGRNIFRAGSKHRFLHILIGVFREPMFILLSIACTLYFILGNTSEGIIMAIAMAIVTAISLYQEVRSSRALEALKQFTEPKVKVIRDSIEQIISVEELVPGDLVLLEEGMKVPADATVVRSNDLSLNEAIITGESLPVDKSDNKHHNILYQGTTINSGKCMACITAIGNNTVLGKIGKSVEGSEYPKTLLQQQVNGFVKRLAFFGLAGFLTILLINYLHYHQFATSLLFALTLAMSAIPEEIPVAFSSFMALGAYKMSRLGIISRQSQVIENLGAMSTICFDKTGTLTENKMRVTTIYDAATDTIIEVGMEQNPLMKYSNVLLYSLLASESDPFDSMEKAIVEAAHLHLNADAYTGAEMIHEYPLDGVPPMMTHVYRLANKVVVASKGGAERIMKVSKLTTERINRVNEVAGNFGKMGYRVLGVAYAGHEQTEFPRNQDDFSWQFAGLIALHDPLKQNAADVLKKIQDAGIRVKLVTGDFPETAVSVAKQLRMPKAERYHLGSEVMAMSEEELKKIAVDDIVFARMYPDAKARLIKALKDSGEIVAMTGDGVNDGPALKKSDIGIAMGHKGTEIARQAADLVLTDDDLEKIFTAIGEGRKIFNNLVKAIRYIISIHIPIILVASLPLIFGWKFPNIFTPVHVIFLELIMGPTCSIFFEREPVEDSNMLARPRERKKGLFTISELLFSVILGLAITCGVLALYYYYMSRDRSVETTRTIVFTTLILSNIFLTFASRSFTRTMFHTFRYRNNLAPFVIIISIVFLALLHFVPGIRVLFKLVPISTGEFLSCLAVAAICTLWFEIYKALRRKQEKK